MATIFVPKEEEAGERRVAAVPDSVRRLVKDGHAVRVERGAGAGAFVRDEDFAAAGASIEADRDRGWSEADLVLTVGVPAAARVERLKAGASHVGFLWGPEHLDVVRAFAKRKASAFALDALPR